MILSRKVAIAHSVALISVALGSPPALASTISDLPKVAPSSVLPTLEQTITVPAYQPFQTAQGEPSPDPQSLTVGSPLTPLQQHPLRLFNLETANQLPAGAINITGGVRRFDNGSVGGTGLETYFGLVEGGITDKLQLGGYILRFDDPLAETINGNETELRLLGQAVQLKYQILDQDKLKLGVSGSLEHLEFSSDSGLFKPSVNSQFVKANTIDATLQVPISYAISPEFQWHLTPGVAFFPDTVNDGGDFYGTFFHIGTGFSWQPLNRLSLFADVTLPLGPGDNAVNADASLYRQVVWSGGGRILVSPTVGLDVYATNSIGMTPATRLLSFLPGGDQVGVGLNFNYTPDLYGQYPTSFRLPAEVTSRDFHLWQDGITLISADTPLQGSLLVRGGIGAGNDFSIGYGLSDDALLEFVGQAYSDDGSVTYETTIPGVFAGPGLSLKLGAGGKFRFLDQAKGDPFSLSLKTTFAQGTTQADKTGLYSAEAAILYQINPIVALTFNPKFSAFGPVRLLGTGFGVNADVYRGLQVIGEFTPLLTGEQSVWSAGLRYQHTNTGLGIDLFASNAIGRQLVGGLIAESEDTNFGVNLHWMR